MAHTGGYKKVVLQLSSKLHLTSQLPTVLCFRENRYIENTTTYNQIHFQLILFWLHRGENKCSKSSSEKLNPTGRAQKFPVHLKF